MDWLNYSRASLNDRLQYKDSGVEWLGGIPKHWELKRIKETARLINGYPFDSKRVADG